MSSSQENRSDRSVMHDVRNHLNRISMQTELAKLLVEQRGDDSKVTNALNNVLQACEDCSSLLSSQSSNAAK